jgi:hypothetical protein
MKQMLGDPAFPDLVAQWAADKLAVEECDCANDNDEEVADELGDPLLTLLVRLEIAATRLW